MPCGPRQETVCDAWKRQLSSPLLFAMSKGTGKDDLVEVPAEGAAETVEELEEDSHTHTHTHITPY